MEIWQPIRYRNQLDMAVYEIWQPILKKMWQPMKYGSLYKIQHPKRYGSLLDKATNVILQPMADIADMAAYQIWQPMRYGRL